MSFKQTANGAYKFATKFMDKPLSTWTSEALAALGWTGATVAPGTFQYDFVAASMASLLKAVEAGETDEKMLVLAAHSGWAETYLHWRDAEPWTEAKYKKPTKAFGDAERNKSAIAALADFYDDEKERNMIMVRLVLAAMAAVEEPEEDTEEETAADADADAGTIEVDESWIDVLSAEMEKPYYAALTEKVAAERAKYPVYPPEEQVFRALLTPLESVRVVILGQDPYHGPGQAHGLSFSVPRGQTVPPSLVNIYKELQADLGLTAPKHGCLESWAENGVLLLNTALTVRCKSANSHALFGWTKLTDVLIRTVSNCTEHTVFILWGRNAQEKGALIDRSRHLVLEAAHPSPLSAHNGFFGCRHFSKANAYLEKHGRGAVDWSLPA